MSATQWVVRGAVVVGVLGAVMLRPPAELPPEELVGPGPQDMARFTVAPPTAGPRPPAEAGPWEVYATGEVYLDEEGRTYGPPMADVVCVPVDELEAGVDEADLSFWPMPIEPGELRQGDTCPTAP